MFEQNSHLQTTGKDKNNDHVFFYYAIVVDIADPNDSKRVRARIKGIDDKTPDSSLPWCTPFLPLFTITNPKVGEMVKIFTPSKSDLMNKREWIGPVITSFNNLTFESAKTAQSNQDISKVTPNKSLSKIPTAKDAYVNDKDVAIQGRDNTDLIFKDKEVLIRAGKFIFNDKTKVNNKNPSYIQLKLSTNGQRSYSSVVGDKICLITYDGAKKYNTILDEEELKKIVETAFSAAYAEPIVEFLKLMQNFVANHVHPQNLPANKGFGKVPEIINYDLNKIIAPSIKIN